MNKEAIEWFKAVKYSNTSYIAEHLNEMYDARDENGNTGLMHAAFYGNVAVVQLLVEKSARLLNLARKTALMQCVCSDYSLGRASIPDIVNILRRLEAGISDERGCTALMMAAERGDVRSVAALVEYEHGQKDSRGRTALMYAASFGKAECIPALLVETAEIDNKGMTALMFAAYGNSVPIIRQLLRYEARRKNKNNETALIIAIRQGREEAVSELAAHEKDIYYGSLSPYQLAINLQQAGSADILRPHSAPVTTYVSTTRPMLSSVTGEKADMDEGALELTTRPTLRQSDNSESLERIQLHVNTLQQKIDAVMIEMARSTHPSMNTAALASDKSHRDILLQRLEDQDKEILQLKSALEHSQVEVKALKDSHTTLMKRIAEAEKSAAGAQIQLALGVAGEQTNSELIGHLGMLSESISSIDIKNSEEHREFAARLGSLHATLTQAMQVSSSQAEEIGSLRDRLAALHEEVLKLSVNTHDAGAKISSFSRALEMRVLNLEARLGAQNSVSSLGVAQAHTGPSIIRAINHLHEELQAIKRSIEGVSQSLITSHGITMQNLDTLSSTHSMFIANYPIHKSVRDEVRLFEELQNKIVRIEHYMEDMMREDRLSAIMTGFVELNSRVDQLVVDQARNHAANLSGRVDEVERTLDAILTVLNITSEGMS